eukprot:GHVU01124465.1.p1 GENE.GHVU01124465.1~~GHVU01124465.1.p1  ORF type:complete len:146 (+),score=37.91 GHVU01124465.1:1461-1898(+)
MESIWRVPSCRPPASFIHPSIQPFIIIDCVDAGKPCTGKKTLGRHLGAKHGLPVVSFDEVVAEAVEGLADQQKQQLLQLQQQPPHSTDGFASAKSLSASELAMTDCRKGEQQATLKHQRFQPFAPTVIEEESTDGCIDEEWDNAA